MGALVLRREARGEHALSLAESLLYHQIHPIKVFSDVATAVIALDLFWRNLLGPGLVIGCAVPFLVSAALIGEVDLERYRRSAMGAYLRRFMPAWIQALRFFGVALAFYAAWHHVPAGIVGGLGLVAVCWAHGIVRRGR
jgi:hypothetical protein